RYLFVRRPRQAIAVRQVRPRQGPQTEARLLERPSCIGLGAHVQQSRRPRDCRVRARAGDRPESRYGPRMDRSGEDFFRTLRGDRGPRPRSAAHQPTRHFRMGWMGFVGIAKSYVGRDEEAVVWLNRSIEMNPSAPIFQFYLASALARGGRLEEAREAARA